VSIVLVTGGARAGKSGWAEAEAVRLAGDDVTFIATAEPRDDEMAARIAAHRAARPDAWTTIEAPLLVPEAVRGARSPVVIVDCLTLWVSNLMLGDADRSGGRHVVEHVEERAEELVAALSRHTGTVIVVTNEVGLGLVPDNPVARAYRDLLGRVNARVARDADRVVLLVAGIAVGIR
jgi:adenosylcobinamide kinase/adenosylcobinamide-phosphate guanylyltransferase/adenosylcobyric acid synthase